MAYKRAPITEAVLDLRFARPLDPATVEKAASRAGREYEFQDPEKTVNLQFDAATEKAKVQQWSSGKRLSSTDRTDICIISTLGFTCSRLAPYLGWDMFQPRATREWDILRKVAGPIELARIGVRYINRIDVPLVVGKPILLEDYLSVWPNSPDALGEPLTGYTMQIVRPLGIDDCSLILNSGSVAPPLIGFASFLLDLDVHREAGLPRRDDELWKLIERIRQHKNRIFENCITDRARALFET